MKSRKHKQSTRKRLSESSHKLELLLPTEVPLSDFRYKEHTPVLRILLSSLDEKNPYTHGHSIRVAEYSSVTAIKLGFDQGQLDVVQIAALLHDIGKIGIPDAVLQKAAKLTKSEFEIMKTHPTRSANILKESGLPNEIVDAVHFHHERLDGFGYPEGLKGDEIPLISRIILIADTFDAMTSTRPYRLPLTQDTSFFELNKYGGTQFDQRLVDAFIEGMQDAEIHELAIESLLKKLK